MSTSPHSEVQPAGIPVAAPLRSPFLQRALAAFTYRDFRVLWFGAFTSTVGTWMQKVAQSWLVFDLTKSSFYLGLDDFLGQLPILLFTLIGGVIADRHDRRRLLLGSQYVQMATAFTLAALVFWSHVTVWHILALSFTAGLAQAFGGPAYQSLVPSLVNKKDLPNAIALKAHRRAKLRLCAGGGRVAGFADRGSFRLSLARPVEASTSSCRRRIFCVLVAPSMSWSTPVSVASRKVAS